MAHGARSHRLEVAAHAGLGHRAAATTITEARQPAAEAVADEVLRLVASAT